MRRFTTGWEVSTTLTDAWTSVNSSTGYTQSVSTTTPRSGLNKYRVVRNAANTAYANTLVLTTDIPAYNAAFSPAVTLAEDLDTSETGVDVNDASGITIGEMILVSQELMLVTAKAGNTLTVTRGQLEIIGWPQSETTHANGAAVTRYGRAFSPAVTAAEAIDSTETGIDVNDASGIQIGDMIRCDNELMVVTGILVNTLTVVRGRSNTSGAAHANGQVMQQAGDAFTYTSLGDDVTVGDCIVIDSEEMIVSSEDTTNNILRCHRARGVNGTTTATHAAAAAINCGWTGSGGTIIQDFSPSASIQLCDQYWTGSGFQDYLLDYNDPNSACYVRVFFNVAVAPAGFHTIRIFELRGGGATQAHISYVNGELVMATSSGSANRTLFTPTVNTWYRMEIELRGAVGGTIPAGQYYAVNIYEETTSTLIAGTTENSAAGGFGANIDSIRMGMLPSAASGLTGAGSGDFDIAFDDFAINDNAGTMHSYMPAIGKVIGCADPVTADALAEFLDTETGVVGTNHFALVNDWNSSPTTDYLKTTNVAATCEDRLSMTTSATLGVVGTVTALQCYIRHADVAGEDGANHSWGIKDSAANDGVTCFSQLYIHASDTEQFQHYPVNGTGTNGDTAFTNASFDACEFYVKHTSATAGQRKKIYAMRAEVEEDGGSTVKVASRPNRRQGQGSVI